MKKLLIMPITLMILIAIFFSFGAEKATAKTPVAKVVSSKNTTNSNQSSSQSREQLLKTLTKFNDAIGVQSKVQILTEKKTLGSKSKAEGELLYSKNKMFLGLNGDKKTDFIYNGSEATLINYPDQELDPDGKRKVLVFTKSKKNNLTPFLEIFTEPKSFLTNYQIVKAEVLKNEKTLTLNDKSKQLKNIKITFDVESSTLKKFSYVDDVETETQIVILDAKYDQKISQDKFTYKKLKTDEVITQ